MASPPLRLDAAAPREWWTVFDPRTSLPARGALGLGGAVLLFAALLAWLAGRHLERALAARLGAQFEMLAQQVADKLDRTLYERSRALQLVAGLPAWRDTAATVAARRALLGDLQAVAPDFAWIGFADTAGRVAVATGGHFEHSDVVTRPWFLRARAQPYAGGPREFPSLAQISPAPADDDTGRFLDLAVPVAGADGAFAGVLAAHLRWGWAREVQLSVVPEAARRERLGTTVYAADGEVLLDSGGSGWTEPPAAPVPPETARLRGAMAETTTDGATYFTGYVRSRGYRDYRGQGWLVAVRQPLADAFRPVAALRHTVLAWGALFTVAAAAAGWLAGAQIERRYRAIAAAAERIGTGDVLTVFPQPHDTGAHARMCAALGRMLDTLRPPPR